MILSLVPITSEIVQMPFLTSSWAFPSQTFVPWDNPEICSKSAKVFGFVGTAIDFFEVVGYGRDWFQTHEYRINEAIFNHFSHNTWLSDTRNLVEWRRYFRLCVPPWTSQLPAFFLVFFCFLRQQRWGYVPCPNTPTLGLIRQLSKRFVPDYGFGGCSSGC